MSNYKWTIVALDCIPMLNGMKDYVVTCHWRYGIENGTDPEAPDYVYTDIYGAEGFTQNPDMPDFTPYADLTEAQVIGWLESSLDVPAMQEQLAKALENIINPPIVQPALPWQS